ncbi:MAG: hypothetical protein A2698_00460 [Candidatus Levybacteria bacterium RIFCSPHIGHO2_01_FULL_42_15]|nr:MAG: hypothetical protein A2698_00460 [Candidatus Levybacteria bacterium RIFCSPHIGHO2_01_FULL_42_15]
MMGQIIEASYPIRFREKDAASLGNQLKKRSSVVLIGMKRVGISNFLRFFLYHQKIIPIYIGRIQSHLFIPVDLNDLVEREISPFWILTLKRIVDAVEGFEIDISTKEYIQSLFLESIQSKDLFFTIDSVRRSLVRLVEKGTLPTLFLIRFDRLKDVVTSEFFANLQGLKDATHQKLAYVFTSFRSLDELEPHVFSPASLSVFCHNMYIKPAKPLDTRIIYESYKDRYQFLLSHSLKTSLFDTVDGYIQYLQLSLIILGEQNKTARSKSALFSSLLSDERMSLQSEELWESLSKKEQTILKKVGSGNTITDSERKEGDYLWNTGFIHEEKGIRALFSPLFASYLSQKGEKVDGETEFTKKEHKLFGLLKNHLDEVCEREAIIETVWPEVEALGVSDWAIDRLVARVRVKLKRQKGAYEIQTVKTRGYKMVVGRE